MYTSTNKSQDGRLRTLAYFDQIIFSTDQLTPTDRIVALGILQYVNSQAGSTYVDLLTLAKRLGILHPIVKMAASRLVELGHLKITKRAGKTPLLVPVLKECGEHSRRGDKAFYAARGKLIQELVFDRRLTPAERLTGIAYVALADCESWECDVSQREMARTVAIHRTVIRGALEKLAELRYFATTETGTVGVVQSAVQWAVQSTRKKARQMGISERNSINPHNLVEVAGREAFSLVKDTGDMTPPDAAAGRGISLVAKVNGCAYAEAAQMIAEVIDYPSRRRATG